VKEKMFENSIPKPAKRGSMMAETFGRMLEGIVNSMTSAALAKRIRCRDSRTIERVGVNVRSSLRNRDDDVERKVGDRPCQCS